MERMERERKREVERRRWQIASELTHQLIERPDMYAVQLPDGRYVAVKKHFTPGMMYLHLQGQVTVGAYLLSEQSTTHQLVLDADADESFEQLKHLAGILQAQGVAS